MVRCPICSELLEELTTIHCKNVHGLPKQQVIERYGKPQSLFAVYTADSNQKTGHVISKRDFPSGQQFSDRVRSKKRKFRSDR